MVQNQLETSDIGYVHFQTNMKKIYRKGLNPLIFPARDKIAPLLVFSKIGIK